MVGEGQLSIDVAAELVARGAAAEVVERIDDDVDDVAGVLVMGQAGADTIDVAAASQRHVTQALDIIRALGRTGGSAPRFGVVTHGATDAAGVASRPVDAAALGPVLVAPKEYPGLTSTLVDVHTDGDAIFRAE